MSNSLLRDISLDTLKRATEIRDEIERLEGVLDSLLTGKTPGRRGRPAKTPAKKKRGGKRKMSPEGVARIKAAQKKRWDAIRAQQKADPMKPKGAAKPRTKSPAKKKVVTKKRAAKK